MSAKQETHMSDPPVPEPSPSGTQRRLQALMNRGWSPEAIAGAAGINALCIITTVHDRRHLATELDDHEVANAYDLLWDRPPPAVTARDRELAAAARATAERHSWPPPMAWDDDVIDLPDGRPTPRWKPSRTRYRSADLAEDLAWIREQGGYRHASITVAAARLGVKRDTLEQACRRAARQSQLEAEAG
jgi:hypothetical protein